MRLTTNLNAIVAGNSLSVAPADRQSGGQNGSAREIELKFLVNETEFKTIQQSTLLGSAVGRGVTKRLHSVYFDTEAGDLRRHRIVLRVRRVGNNHHVLTLKWDGKTGGGTFERGEIEVPAPSPVPDPALLGAAIEAEIRRVTEGRPLQPFFATDIKRVVRRIMIGASELEAAFDSGFIVFGTQKSPVREIELELKAGDPADLYQFGLSLTENFPICLGTMTKAQRGVQLSGGVHATSVRATVPDLAEHTVDQAVDAVIRACMAQFVGNWPVFQGPEKAPAVHQMRISMRRLRTALALFNRRFPCVEFRELRAEAKRIASALGEARNWDVFESLLRGGPCSIFPSEAGFAALTTESATRREAAYAAVAELLADTATTRFVLSVETFVARRGWRNALPGDALPRLTEPATGFAADSLERLHWRVRKRGKALLDLPPEERHGVRIALKNLRYAADFFGDLFGPTDAVKSYTRATARLQDALGSFNDMVMVTGLVRQLDVDDALPARAAGIISGWYAHGARMNDANLQDVWRGFRKARPFWS